MHRRTHVAAGSPSVWVLVILLVFPLGASTASAQTPCAEFSDLRLRFNCRYSGPYRSGESYDTITVTPGGNGESLADAGITLDVTVRDCQGAPIAGVPAEAVVLRSASLCACAGGLIADAPTDANGRTRFREVRLRAGGSASTLEVVADGVSLGDVSLTFNGPANRGSGPHCAVDADAVTWFGATTLRSEFGDLRYSIDADLNEDDFVDLIDMALFARHLDETCTPAAKSTLPPARLETPNEVLEPPRVGIYFDSLGTVTCADLTVGEAVDFWVVAFLDGSELTGLSAAEFRIEGLPESVVYSEVESLHDMSAGKDPSADGATLAWSSCASALEGPVTLLHGSLRATEPVPATAIRITGHQIPSNDGFRCPVLTRCNIPSACDPDPQSAQVCAVGLPALLNPEPNPCETAITPTSWSHVKRLFR